MNDRMYNQELEKVLDEMGGFYNVHDIFERISDGRMQSFVSHNSWMITEIQLYPRRKVLDVPIIVGDWEDFEPLYERLVQYANEIGASLIRGFGRRGWSKALKSRGWVSVGDTYHKDL